jgi:hypothetical protein
MVNMTERLTWLEGAVELESTTDDGMICRFLVDRDGDVASFTVERSTMRFRDDGEEADGHEPGEPGFIGPPITATWIKKFAFGSALNAAKRETGWWRLVRGEPLSDDDRAAIEVLPSGHTFRPPGLGVDYYADVARRYVDALAAGSTSPTKDVAEGLGVEAETATNHVRRARDLDLLAPKKPGRGRPRGELTPTAAAILAENRGDEQ